MRKKNVPAPKMYVMKNLSEKKRSHKPIQKTILIEVFDRNSFTRPYVIVTNKAPMADSSPQTKYTPSTRSLKINMIKTKITIRSTIKIRKEILLLLQVTTAGISGLYL